MASEKSGSCHECQVFSFNRHVAIHKDNGPHASNFKDKSPGLERLKTMALNGWELDAERHRCTPSMFNLSGGSIKKKVSKTLP